MLHFDGENMSMVIIGFMHADVLALDYSTSQNFQEGYAVNRAMTKL